ncbi:hypothetical protein [Thermodesulfovibrio hydrogeniphilus]
MRVTSTFKWLVTLFLLFLPLVADGYLSYAAQIDERRIKNHSYHFSSLNSTVTLVDGKYSDPNLAEVRLLSYTVRPPSLQRYETLPDVAIIFEIVREGKKYHEILGLVSTENQLLQTNSIIIETILQSNLPVKAVSDMYMYMSTGDHDIRPRGLTSCVNVILRLDSGVESLCFLLSKSKDPPSYILRYEVPKIVKKPALYLYPLTETMVSVKLRPLGHLTETIPDYRNEWKVRVSAEGLIERRYRYLFYEVSLWYPVEAPDEGWCVKYENLKAWLTKKLPSLGLKDWEVRDFVDYWLKNLKRVEYYIIKPLSQEWINTNLSVEIDPKPDTFIRVILLFIPSNKPVNLKEPIISPLKRKGFTAVEWGGIVGANSSYVSEDGTADSTYSRADIYDTRKIGLIPLRGVTIQRDSIRIRVSSGGCTDTKHVRASVKVNTPDWTKIPVCEIGFYRIMPDNCKANFPDGVFLEYDMVHDLGIKSPCMVRILNPVLVEGVVKSAQSEKKRLLITKSPSKRH